jgi:hypothetical protein
MRKILMSAVAASTSLAVAATVPAEATATHQAGVAPSPVFKTVAKGLHNPRQIAFRDGAMYVAEAGSGSFDGTSSSGPCMTGGEGSTVCFGKTGSVMRVLHGKQRRVLTGIASLGAETDGSGAIGPADLAVVGKHTIVLSVGLGSKPHNRSKLPKLGQQEMARLLSFDLRTKKRAVIGDLGRHEARANPIDDPDTDPTGVAPAGKLGYLVTDSGGNTLLRAAHGKVHGVAAFKDRTSGSDSYQSVPTDVVNGPDGAWYVSELTGAPFIAGAARIWRVRPGHKPHVWASGLTNVTSLAFDGKKLYAVQIADGGLSGPPIGSLLRVFPDTSKKSPQTLASGLFAPYGVAVHRNSAYVSLCAVCATGGTVIKVPLG